MIQLRWLVLAVLALPFAEFAAFWVVSGRIGILGALAGVIATSLLGVLILKGGAKLLLAQLAAGRLVVLSAEAVRSGVLLAFAGLLLAIPGYVTDVLALACFVPILRDRLSGRSVVAGGTAQTPPPPGVVDLDPADWREDRNGPRPPPRLDTR